VILTAAYATFGTKTAHTTGETPHPEPRLIRLALTLVASAIFVPGFYGHEFGFLDRMLAGAVYPDLRGTSNIAAFSQP
jgi:hypothetical protein